MAHLRLLNIKCYTHGCPKKATEELFSNRNQTHGRYCNQCAEKRLKELTEVEQQQASRQAAYDAIPKCTSCPHKQHEGRKCGGLDAAGDTCDC